MCFASYSNLCEQILNFKAVFHKLFKLEERMPIKQVGKTGVGDSDKNTTTFKPTRSPIFKHLVRTSLGPCSDLVGGQHGRLPFSPGPKKLWLKSLYYYYLLSPTPYLSVMQLPVTMEEENSVPFFMNRPIDVSNRAILVPHENAKQEKKKS